jgi:hypothetical protein
MRPDQVFGVVVRAFGLLAWVSAVYFVFTALVLFADPDPRRTLPLTSHYVAFAILLCCMGWFLLRRAPLVVAYAYRLPKDIASDL